VFLSSDNYTGNLGRLAGADAVCQRLAGAAGLAGTFKAWLSDSTTSARDRLTHSVVPYVLVTGETVASNGVDLTDGTLQKAITVDEEAFNWIGNCSLPWPSVVWTGTQIDGSSEGPYCSDWRSSATEIRGQNGHYCWTSEAWTHISWAEEAGACSNRQSLYCFQQ
jgi:hypothetical protein